MSIRSLIAALVLGSFFGSFVVACSDDSSGKGSDGSVVEETEYVSCLSDEDCGDSASCAKLEGDAHTVSVCVKDVHVPCIADYECDGGICIAVAGLQQTICTQPIVDDCPFHGFDGLEYEVNISNETLYLVTEYLSDSCEMVLRLKSDLSNMAWHYVLYVDEEGNRRGVVGNGSLVEVLHLSLGWIHLRETDPDGTDPTEYMLFLVSETSGG